MAISSVGVGYKFLPPVLRDDPNLMSGRSGGSPKDTAPVTGTAATPTVIAPAAAVEHASTGKHLLRITV